MLPQKHAAMALAMCYLLTAQAHLVHEHDLDRHCGTPEVRIRNPYGVGNELLNPKEASSSQVLVSSIQSETRECDCPFCRARQSFCRA
jgi:hypothetical protein